MLLYLKLLSLSWDNFQHRTQRKQLTVTPNQSKESNVKTVHPGEQIRHTIAVYYLERRYFL
ncbi:hypothetical protein [Laspinema palackyanum]|uniref:hypothetical protein n=1 Tax=Laspinema palackyanum TaxID=3231601 RepID=UPI00345D6A51|nr:hypothetical protein [Laspinema sp. D2c]